jgi:hypothetical protein
MVPEPKTRGNPHIKAKFFKEGNTDCVEVAIIGDPNIYHGRATPQDVARFPKEWEAYQAGLDLPTPEGTPLTDIPGFTQELERMYKMYGIHVVEQLATASDIAIQKLGIGSVTFRKHAQNLLSARMWEKAQAAQEAKFVEPKGHAAASDSPSKAKKAKEA